MAVRLRAPCGGCGRRGSRANLRKAPVSSVGGDAEALGPKAAAATGRSSSLSWGPPTDRNAVPATGDEAHPGRDQGLHEGVREGRAEAGDLAGRLHLDAEQGV